MAISLNNLTKKRTPELQVSTRFNDDEFDSQKEDATYEETSSEENDLEGIVSEDTTAEVEEKEVSFDTLFGLGSEEQDYTENPVEDSGFVFETLEEGFAEETAEDVTQAFDNEQEDEEPEPEVEAVAEPEKEVEPEEKEEIEVDDSMQSEEVYSNEEVETEVDQPRVFIPQLKTEHFEIHKASYSQAYSISVEQLAIDVLNHHQVTNISLAAFGPTSNLYVPQSLDLIEYGIHKFVGRQLSEIDQFRLFYEINAMFEKHPIDQFVLKLTQEIEYQGVKYTTLVASAEDLKRYSAAFISEVSVNMDEPDEHNLVAVIKKCKV